MRFVIINPKEQRLGYVDCEDLEKAKLLAGLADVDHGVLVDGVGYCVYEYGMFTDPKEIGYFSIGRRLVAGNAVLYGFDRLGKDVSLGPQLHLPLPVFYQTIEEVEAAIASGMVERPFMAVNNVRSWQWPQGMGE